MIKKSIDLTLNPRESLTREFTFSSLSAWSGNVAYRIDLKEKNILLDSLTSSFRYVPIPEIVASSRTVELWNTKDFSYTFPRSASGMDAGSSLVTIALSPSYIMELSNMIRSLEAYPYGSIEQTIGSTLPNALALNFSEK